MFMAVVALSDGTVDFELSCMNLGGKDCAYAEYLKVMELNGSCVILYKSPPGRS